MNAKDTPLKKLILLFIVLLVGGVFLSGCSTSLPKGAQTEIVEFFRDNVWQQTDYEITSVVKGEAQYVDELYCFTVSPARIHSGRTSYSNFIARRQGLLWQITTVDREESFLLSNCDNYDH